MRLGRAYTGFGAASRLQGLRAFNSVFIEALSGLSSSETLLVVCISLGNVVTMPRYELDKLVACCRGLNNDLYYFGGSVL